MPSGGYGRVTISAASVMDQFYGRIGDADAVSALHKAGHKVCQSALCRGTEWTSGAYDFAPTLKSAERDVSRDFIYFFERNMPPELNRTFDSCGK